MGGILLYSWFGVSKRRLEGELPFIFLHRDSLFLGRAGLSKRQLDSRHRPTVGS